MMESFSFTDGARLGGQILWQEPESNLARRKMLPGDTYLIPTVPVGTGVAFAIFMATRRPETNNLPVIALIILIGVVIGIAIFLKILSSSNKIRNIMTALTVYENGISLSIMKKPYYRFSDVYFIEQWTDGEKKTNPFTTVLTLRDATPCMVGSSIFPDGESYKAFHSIVTNRFAELNKGYPWAKDAEDLVSSLEGFNGHIRLIVEDNARRLGKTEVDLGFVQSHWKDIMAVKKCQKIRFLAQINRGLL